MRRFFTYALLAALPLAPAMARDFSDPSWPCIQRKAERLSYGTVWPEEITPVDLPAPARDLARKLALRRVSLDEAEALVADFAQDPQPPGTYGAIFLEAFTRMDRERTQIVQGIGRYSLSQIALSEKITEIRAEMDTIMASPDPDFDRVDVLEQTLDWDSRIHHERQSVLTYVCESPVLLEKRIYAIGQLLLARDG